MEILKFGGTSLGSSGRIKKAVDIIRSRRNCLVVCSAMAGMTNSLLMTGKYWEEGNTEEAKKHLQAIREKFEKECNDLFQEDSILLATGHYFEEAFDLLHQPPSRALVNRITALGEQLTSLVVQLYVQQNGTNSQLIDATEIIRLKAEGEPDVDDIAFRLKQIAGFHTQGIFVTQGYICRNHSGQVATLTRGGSDFSATLFGAAIQAELIEIWTDIDGLHNNDPRYVQGTTPVRELSYTEAAELAYFGAKILHPSCVRPAREKGIPIKIKNTLQPQAKGTLISTDILFQGIRAVAAKDNISVLRITSGRMFNAHGFMAKVFEIFSHHKVAVDVVTTSEVSVSVTVEDVAALAVLSEDLSRLGRIDIERQRSIICVVGDVLRPGLISRITELLKDFNIRMVSLGASSNNITFVLPQKEKGDALNALHKLFETTKENSSLSCQTTL